MKPCRATETAQRFLASSYDAVNGLLASYDLVRESRTDRGVEKRGRLTDQEGDLIRAAITFSCAGLDAALKRVIRDALPALLERSRPAHERFEKFVALHIGPGEVAHTGRIAQYLVQESPRTALIESYIYDLTGSSLQSAEEVGRVAAALGLDDPILRKRIAGMGDLFKARNQISHELDLQKIQKQGDRSRRTRNLEDSLKITHEAVEVAQLVINDVAVSLSSSS